MARLTIHPTMNVEHLKYRNAVHIINGLIERQYTSDITRRRLVQIRNQLYYNYIYTENNNISGDFNLLYYTYINKSSDGTLGQIEDIVVERNNSTIRYIQDKYNLIL